MEALKEEKQPISDAPQAPGAQEIFAGDEKFYSQLEGNIDATEIFAPNLDPAVLNELKKPSSSASPSSTYVDHAAINSAVEALLANQKPKEKLKVLQVIITAVIVIICGLLLIPISLFCMQILLSPKQASKPAGAADPAKQSDHAQAGSDQDPKASEQIKASEKSLDEPASWQLAQSLYKQRNYAHALWAYRRLISNLGTDAIGQATKDYLTIKVGLCCYRMGSVAEAETYFQKALASQSPAVSALASYHYAHIQFQQKNYLAARSRAYQCLGLLAAIDSAHAEPIAADCQFLLAQALTTHVVSTLGSNAQIPAGWPSLEFSEPLDDLDSEQIEKLLANSQGKLKAAVLGPQIERLTVGEGEPASWQIKSSGASIEELYVKFSAAGGPDIHWSCDYSAVHARPSKLILNSATTQRFAEISAGAVGLIASFATGKVLIYNPEIYSSINEQYAMLTSEAIAAWQRFVFGYRSDKRLAEAHFALGLLQNATKQQPAAIGEFRQVANRFPSSPLASYSLFNSGKIRLELKDYTGSRQDLRELTAQYPDSPICDQANVLFAQTAFATGDYETAAVVFRRIYNMDSSVESKISAAMGCAKCAYARSDFKDAAEWFEKYTTFAKGTAGTSAAELQNAYVMMAQCKAKLGELKEACEGYQKALADAGDATKSFEIAIELAKTFKQQDQYIEALETLERVNLADISAMQTFKLWHAKAQVYRSMGLYEQGIDCLEGKIAGAPDVKTKNELLLEFARCSYGAEEYEAARDAYCKVLMNNENGYEIAPIQGELAQTCLKLGDNAATIETAKKALKGSLTGKTKNRTVDALAQAYKNTKQYDMAAQVLAGKF